MSDNPASQLIKFVPVPGANYRYDFPKIILELEQLAQTDTLRFMQFARFWCTESLFFLLYFVLRVPVNEKWLVDRINEVQDCNDRTMDLWFREGYKALAIDTKVLTINGWKCHGDLQPGDEIFGSNGQIVTVIANTGVLYNAKCRKISFDDCDMIASAEHIWPICRRREPVVPGSDKRTRSWDDFVIEYVTTDNLPINNRRKHLPRTPTINFPVKLLPLPLDPYILGYWLGDGTTTNGRITTIDIEVLDYFLSAGFEIHPYDNEHYNIYDLQTILRQLNVLGNKHIPSSYLTASSQDRLALLQGLMDSDGCCRGNGQCVFVNTNWNLASGVHYLAASLGFKPTIWVENREENRKDVFCVNFVGVKKYLPFKLKRKLAVCKEEYTNKGRYVRSIEQVASVPVNCIQVDAEDGIYLAGLSMVPTHNSTIITYGQNIREILTDPNVRIGIFSHTRGISKAFLRRIKITLESNELLKALFPDILYDNPSSQSPKWSEDDGLVVKRQSVFNECTVEAYGLVDGQPTSRHYSVLNYDDVVTRDSVSTPDQLAKIEDCFRLSLNLGADGGKKRIIGTIYHFADLYCKLIKEGAWKLRKYPAEDENGNSVFLPKEVLVEKRKDMGPYVYNTQMLLNPVAKEEQKFQYNWLQWYKKLPDNLTLFLLCDPANTKKVKKSGSDYTVYCLIGLDSRDNRFLVDIIRDRLTLTERWEALKKMVRKWPNIQKIGYEQYGMTADIQHFEKMMEVESFYFPRPVELSGNKLSKEDRIARLIPQFERGRIWLPEALPFKDKEGNVVDLIKTFVDDEYLVFPFSVHDDVLDAMSRIEDENFNTWLPYEGPTDPADDPRPQVGVLSTGWAETKSASRFANC